MLVPSWNQKTTHYPWSKMRTKVCMSLLCIAQHHLLMTQLWLQRFNSKLMECRLVCYFAPSFVRILNVTGLRPTNNLVKKWGFVLKSCLHSNHLYMNTDKLCFDWQFYICKIAYLFFRKISYIHYSLLFWVLLFHIYQQKSDCIHTQQHLHRMYKRYFT